MCYDFVNVWIQLLDGHTLRIKCIFWSKFQYFFFIFFFHENMKQWSSKLATSHGLGLCTFCCRAECSRTTAGIGKCPEGGVLPLRWKGHLCHLDGYRGRRNYENPELSHISSVFSLKWVRIELWLLHLQLIVTSLAPDLLKEQNVGETLPGVDSTV